MAVDVRVFRKSLIFLTHTKIADIVEANYLEKIKMAAAGAEGTGEQH